MSKLRLKVDLSEFFEDERRLAYVLVNMKWGLVEELEEHVGRMFKVPKVHFTTDDGVFIPSMESIEVIKDSTFLKAFLAQRLKKKRLIQRGSDDDEVVAALLVGDKRKNTVNGSISSSTPNGPIKKKRRTSMDCTIAAPKMSSTSKTVNVPVTSSNDSPKSEKSSSDLSKSGETAEETVKARKRKRLRKKKRQTKESPSTCQNSDKSTRFSCVPVPISSSTLRLSKSMSTPQGKHVHFDESPTLVPENGESQEDAVPEGRRVIFRCRLSGDASKQAREITAEETTPKKPEIVIHENILLVGGKDSSEDCNNSSVIEIEDSMLKAPTDPLEDITADQSNISLAIATVDQILADSVPLVGLPKAGDVILFKMLRLSDESTPVASEYICAKCDDVDSETKKIRCTISDGHDQLEETVRKCPEDKGDSTQVEETRFECFLDEMVDPKVLQVP